MSQIRPLIPLLVTAGILIGGNGLQGTFISLRALEEGFSTSLIGVIGAGYNVGFAVGCVYVTRILRSIGHIRTFSAMAAIASAAAIAMVLVIEPWFWFLMRLIAGICFASLFATVESWLNASVTNGNRARTLSIYRLVDLGSVTAAQYLIPGVGIGGFELFAIISMVLTLSLVPISFADRSSPVAPEAIRFDVRALWNISPLATIGCIRRRPHECGLSLARADLCAGDRPFRNRDRDLHERRHHRRGRLAVPARALFGPD
jgi:MFS family permease